MDTDVSYQISKQGTSLTALDRDGVTKAVRSGLQGPVVVSQRVVVHVADDALATDAAVSLVDGRVVAVEGIVVVRGALVVAGIDAVSVKQTESFRGQPSRYTCLNGSWNNWKGGSLGIQLCHSPIG